MRKCIGATEFCWGELSEDNRFYWKVFCRTVALLGGAIFAGTTGNSYLDLLIAIITASFLWAAVETQRSYSKMSARLRKRCVRFAVLLGSWAVAVPSTILFSHVALVSAAQVYGSDVSPALATAPNPKQEAVLIGALLIALVIAPIRIFRQLKLEELIFRLPHNGLKRILVHKELEVATFVQFAYFELSALCVCFVYSFALAEVVKGLLLFL